MPDSGWVTFMQCTGGGVAFGQHREAAAACTKVGVSGLRTVQELNQLEHRIE